MMHNKMDKLVLRKRRKRSINTQRWKDKVCLVEIILGAERAVLGNYAWFLIPWNYVKYGRKVELYSSSKFPNFFRDLFNTDTRHLRTYAVALCYRLVISTSSGVSLSIPKHFEGLFKILVMGGKLPLVISVYIIYKKNEFGKNSKCTSPLPPIRTPHASYISPPSRREVCSWA